MSRIRVYFEESPESTPLDAPLDALLIGTILFAPLALGSIDPKFEMILQIATAIAVSLFGIKLTLYPSAKIATSWIYLPIVAFISLAAFQLLPLPQSLAAVVSPNTVSVKRDLLADLPNAGELLAKVRLTFYAEPTLRQLRQVLMVSAIFVLVLNQFRTLAKIRRMLIALSAVGAFCSGLAILQILTGTDSIYWYIYSGSSRADGGTFANHSHFSQMANLCIGAMLSLLFLTLHEQLGSHYHATDLMDCLRTEHGRVLWLLIGAIVLSAVAIPMSLSRGGMIALLFAAIVTISLYAVQNRQGGFGWIGSLIAAIVLSVIFYLGFDRIADRYTALHDLQPASTRWAMVLGCLDAFKQFPLVGVGLGAFRYVYPRYDRTQEYGFATHAENEYAQLLMETGVIGAAIIAVFIVMVFAGYVRAIRHRASPFAVVAIGLGFGWIAILIQSLSDFGQHMPGVAFLTATVSALIIAVSRAVQYDPKTSEDRAGWPVLRGLATLGVIAVFGLASASAVSVWRADARWLKVVAEEDLIRRDNWQVDPARVVRLLENAGEVVAIRPNNVIYRHLQNEFRMRGATMARDPKTGNTLLNAELRDGLRRVVSEIDSARILCPTYGPLFATAGGIRMFLLDDPTGGPLIAKAAMLFPNDTTVLRLSAELHASQGDWDQTVKSLKRQVAIQPGSANEAVDLLVRNHRRGDLAVELIGKSSAAGYLVRTLEQADADAALIAEARRNHIEFMNTQLMGRLALPSDYIGIAREYTKLGEHDQADALYQKAIGSSSATVDTRLDYAEFLDKSGRTPEALAQVAVALSIEPFNARAAELQRQLRQLRRKDAGD